MAWRSQSVAPGGAPTTTIELSISGSGLAFGAPRVLERFRDLGGFVPPAGSLRLLRLSSEAVMIAWTGVDSGHYVVRASPVSLRRGAWAPVVISGVTQPAPRPTRCWRISPRGPARKRLRFGEQHRARQAARRGGRAPILGRFARRVAITRAG